MNTQIIKTFVENFSQLYTECTTSEKAPLVIEYLSKLQNIKNYVDYFDLNTERTNEFYEGFLVGILTRANSHRASYPKDTYGYAAFNSIFDLGLETLNEFHNAA